MPTSDRLVEPELLVEFRVRAEIARVERIAKPREVVPKPEREGDSERGAKPDEPPGEQPPVAPRFEGDPGGDDRRRHGHFVPRQERAGQPDAAPRHEPATIEPHAHPRRE